MENIILEGKLVQVMAAQEGVSTRGAWKKQDFVIETTEQYPKKICISCWNEKADDLKNYQPNDLLKIAVNIESREYNSKWYTDIKAWKIDALTASSSEGATANSGSATPVKDGDDILGVSFSDEEDELPF